jgi:hypothetical protein
MIDYPANIGDFVPGSEHTKPHKGRIEQWSKVTYPSEGVTLVWGLFDGHPNFSGYHGHTSYIVSQEGNEIETRNSRYTLGEPLNG